MSALNRVPSAMIDDQATIPLDRLIPWQGNVRKSEPDSGLDQLAASIHAHGLLQGVIVYEDGDLYKVVAGKRRLAALQLLQKQGKLASDHAVQCRIIPSQDDATELSLAENLQRLAMHPADEFDAFKSMVEAGAAIPDIAHRFGVTEKYIQGRLRMARVSPLILKAYRTGELSLDAVKAYAISDDLPRQERLYQAGESWVKGNPRHIREALTEGETPATDRRAAFVGIEAYQAAGGTIRRDLFAEGDEGVYLCDRQLMLTLAERKLSEEADRLKADGWSFVIPRLEYDYSERAAFDRLPPEPTDLPPELAKERDELKLELGMLEGIDEDKLTDKEYDRIEEIEARIEVIDDSVECNYAPEVKARAGCYLCIDHRGGFEVYYGLIEKGESAVAKAKSTTSKQTQAMTGEKETPVLSATVTQDLSQHFSDALAAELQKRPWVALATVVHSLGLNVFYPGDTYCSALEMSLVKAHWNDRAAAGQALLAERKRWDEVLPKKGAEFWTYCCNAEHETLLQLLAHIAACSLDAAILKTTDTKTILHSRSLAETVGLNMLDWFKPTAESYFARVSRDIVLTAISEMTGEPVSPSVQKLKKDGLAAEAQRLAAMHSWLPDIMRTPAYLKAIDTAAAADIESDGNAMAPAEKPVKAKTSKTVKVEAEKPSKTAGKAKSKSKKAA